jgi:tricarballylate dehydrogenase
LPVETATLPDVDVLVIGGGNAALCAAIAAGEAGATVAVLEAAPEWMRGGNSRHTRDIRFAHANASAYVTGAYPEAEFWDDLSRVTDGQTTEPLARLVISASEDIERWMMARGVRWQAPLRGTLHLARTNIFMLGGGKAMMNALYAAAERVGVRVLYDANVQRLDMPDGQFRCAELMLQDRLTQINARAVVVASGGFEANVAWLRRYWGEAADNFVIRGTPYNTGTLLAELLEHGAQSIGDPKQFHGVALDARSPKFDGGIVTRLDSVPFGIVVNRAGERFYDEGEDFWPKRYAIWGKLIADQPGQVAYSIVDSQAMGLFLPSVFPPFVAPSLPELAEALGLPAAAVCETVQRYNASVLPGRFDPAALDDCHTNGLDPPKSHWALPIERGPFYGYPLKTGVTFTYMGVTVDDAARVVLQSGQPSTNVFAAGEVMAGNILGKGYLAGFGLTIGTVFGRIAGREAARHAHP